MVILHSFLYVYQRVTRVFCSWLTWITPMWPPELIKAPSSLEARSPARHPRRAAVAAPSSWPPYRRGDTTCPTPLPGGNIGGNIGSWGGLLKILGSEFRVVSMIKNQFLKGELGVFFMANPNSPRLRCLLQNSTHTSSQVPRQAFGKY